MLRISLGLDEAPYECGFRSEPFANKLDFHKHEFKHMGISPERKLHKM